MITNLCIVTLFCVVGRIDLKEETVESLLSTACLLQLSEVVEACCGFLMKQLHPSNCIGIRQFADAQGCADLYKVANNYVMVGRRVLSMNSNAPLCCVSGKVKRGNCRVLCSPVIRATEDKANQQFCNSVCCQYVSGGAL